MAKALIIVDVQNDFVTGSLPVPNAKEIIPIIYWIVGNVQYDLVIETLDWHPENHISFKKWPVHCVQGSVGAQTVLTELSDKCISNLWLPVYKGTDINVDSYSGFFDNDHKTKTDLEEKLKAHEIYKIDELDIVGLATDYCVKFTAIDAINLGYKTNVLTFACRGVTPETTQITIEEMKKNNINIL